MNADITNFIKLEKELDKIASLEKNAYKNITELKEINRIDNKFAEDFIYEYGISKKFTIKEIKERRKIFNMKSSYSPKYYDLPSWDDKTRCPFCNSKLVKKWEGLVCRNNCPLSFKLGNGWVFLQKDSGWSKSRYILNSMMGTSKRNLLQYKFAKLKKEILIRDDYKCRVCGYELDTSFFHGRNKQLEIHHIIPASEEMALYLDKDNLITLCEDCHKKMHSNDKYCFGGEK